MDLEDTYLHYLKFYLESKMENGGLFRTFIDNWFAHSKKGQFLTARGNPRWFNNPNPLKVKDALLDMDFISESAIKIINQKNEGRLVKDHVIPIKILRILICEQLKSKPEVGDIKMFLEKYYRLGVITKEEDELLNSNGLRSSMPEGWNLSDDLFARYEKVKIKKNQ